MHVDSVVMERVAAPALPATRLRLLPWLWALLPFLALVVWRAGQGTGLEADDYGQYLMHARALAEGRSYSDINYIYSPYAIWIGPRAAPPGLPIVLALIQRLFGPNLFVMKAAMLAFATSFVLLGALYFAREAGQRIGWGVALLCGLSPAILHNAALFVTDLPFAAVVWLLIYIMDRAGRFSWARVVAVTALGAFAVMLRPTGIALGGAVLLYGLFHYRTHGLRPLLPLLIWAVGLLVVSAFAHINRAALIQVDPRSVLQWIWREKVPVVNMREYTGAVLASHLYPFAWRPANNAFHALTALLMLIGLGAWVRHAYHRFAVLFAVCYSVLLLIMPLNHTRYTWPLYPFFVFGLLNGIRVVAGYLVRSPARAPAFALAFAIALTPLAAARVLALPAPLNPEDVPEIHQVFQYVRTTAAREPMRVTFFKPRALAWATGVPAMGPLRGRPDCLLGELRNKNITHIIVGSFGGRFNSDLRRVVVLWPGLFSKELQNNTFTVYRFRREQAHMQIPAECL